MRTFPNSSTIVNKKIRARQMLVWSPMGRELGVMTRAQTFQLADGFDLDVVQVEHHRIGGAVERVWMLMDFAAFLKTTRKKIAKKKTRQR